MSECFIDSCPDCASILGMNDNCQYCYASRIVYEKRLKELGK